MGYSQYDFELDARLIKSAIEAWNPHRPRRWLARYGGLGNLKVKKELRDKYTKLTWEAKKNVKL
ncbi:hypothetical protein [Aeromonas salmonicida]|uniref:hypothetical protein n=1 Tax=Aeromonas salmonicida TaxID=645 RepID=UPI00285EFE59|nr:hypothetical protein [Aeromonas salmonicida]MDR7022469.1 hypothetical protein [Aeromonas salmonicida]